MIGPASTFVLLVLLPVDFTYPVFAVLLFSRASPWGRSPRPTGRRDEQPARRRPRRGAGMNATFQNSAQVLSIGIFFSLMIVGAGIQAPTHHGERPRPTACRPQVAIAHLPPVSTLFAAFLGYNPASHLLGPHVLAQLTPSQRAAVTGERFSPSLIPTPSTTGCTRRSPSASSCAWWARRPRGPVATTAPATVTVAREPGAPVGRPKEATHAG